MTCPKMDSRLHRAVWHSGVTDAVMGFVVTFVVSVIIQLALRAWT